MSIEETLNIITITKDDPQGLFKTVNSTRSLREKFNIRQVIVDSSTNDVKIKVGNILTKENNIEYHWQKPSGRSAAFNHGLRLTKSRWVWFLNGGDEVFSGLDSGVFLELLNKNNSDAIIFQVFYKQSSKTYPHPQMWALWPPVLSWIPHPATITRRELYDKYGNFNEKYKIAMDYEFWIRCFSKNVTVDLISMPIAKFDESGISIKSTIDTKKEVRRIICKYFWLFIKKWFNSGKIILKSFKISSNFFK